MLSHPYLCWVLSQCSSGAKHRYQPQARRVPHRPLSPAEAYYQGHGSGEVGWAPIMGVGYYKLLVQRSRGEYLSANNTENDLNRITTLNGFGYRADAVLNTIAGAAPSPKHQDLCLPLVSSKRQAT